MPDRNPWMDNALGGLSGFLARQPQGQSQSGTGQAPLQLPANNSFAEVLQQMRQQDYIAQSKWTPDITQGPDGRLLKGGKPPDTYLPIFDNQGRKVGMQPAWLDQPQQQQAPQIIPEQNAPYIKPGTWNYNTPLLPQEEPVFRQWVQQNSVPFDVNAKVSDYDMRGFWRALQSGDPRAKSAIDPNDGKIHYPDYWKTPYHKTFSNESQWALPNAPHWTDDDKLVAPDGTVLFDDRASKKK